MDLSSGDIALTLIDDGDLGSDLGSEFWDVQEREGRGTRRFSPSFEGFDLAGIAGDAGAGIETDADLSPAFVRVISRRPEPLAWLVIVLSAQIAPQICYQLDPVPAKKGRETRNVMSWVTFVKSGSKLRLFAPMC